MSVQTYSTAGTYTWTCPTGVTSAQVELWGGGGGGGKEYGLYGGGGGGGGAYARKTITVSPGTGYTVVVGAGGLGGYGDYRGNGAASTFATTLVAAGGGYVGYNSSGSPPGGAGGIGGNTGTGDVIHDGGNGADGGTSVGGGGGGSGGSASNGNPGSGTTGAPAVTGGGPGGNGGVNGQAPASGPGGGSGGRYAYGTSAAGWAGQCTITYNANVTITPSQGSAASASRAPSLLANLIPATEALSIAGLAPYLSSTLVPALAATIHITGHAPSLSAGTAIIPGAGAISTSYVERTFTSKASGNWNASGQTTWNEVGIPGLGDVVSISHAVTVSADVGVGTGTGYAIAILSGGSLLIADGITLGVAGDIDNEALVSLGDGSVLTFIEAPVPGYVPILVSTIIPPSGIISISRLQPVLILTLTPSEDALTITGHAPARAIGLALTPDKQDLTVTGLVPRLTMSLIVPTGHLVLSGLGVTLPFIPGTVHLTMPQKVPNVTVVPPPTQWSKMRGI